MRAAEVPDPQVGAEDVLVKIHSAGVNPLDIRIRNGDFKAFMPYRLPSSWATTSLGPSYGLDRK
ncbi:hypothetical protein [Streptomyces antibioticus]|uniref:hypothetical protein n=1 Tax=Streptomyces antibioticus TaxID=1890 RepID=UPI003F6300D4